MTDFLLFSDFHGHSFSYNATQAEIPGFEGIYNSRLRDSALVLDEIREYALENDVEHVLFGGDLFHVRKAIPTAVRSVVMDRLVSMSKAGIKLHLLTGNHDMGNRSGTVHHLQGLDSIPGISVHDTFGSFKIDQYRVITVPYTPDLEKAREQLQEAGRIADGAEEPCFLLAHLGMQGARVGSDFVLISDSDVKVVDVPHEKFVGCFFGHYHEHQKIFPNGWFIGATHQHNWSDSGGKRGFLHAHAVGAKVDFKRIETKAPRFVLVREGEDGEQPRPNDFVKYVASSSSSLDSDAVKEKYGVEHAEVIQETEENSLDFSLDADKLDPMNTLEAWVEQTDTGGFDEKELLELGKTLLSEANENER